MRKLRLILLPFSWIYGSIGAIRNFLYSKNILHSEKITIPSICVGNLSVGGTGKTPHVDYIIDHFIQQGVQSAVLSRGYGRNTKGVLEVTHNSTAQQVGDEPLFYKIKHKSNINVVVAEKRIEGVNTILKNHPKTKLIVLDDAFQHRAIQAGLNIVITDYSDLFVDDFVLPAGNLREFRCGIKRADIIVVSKCPKNTTELTKETIIKKLNFPKEKIYFSTIQYGKIKAFNTNDAPTTKNALIVTGIGNPTPLIDELKGRFNIEHLKYPDHHVFSVADIAQIHEKIDTFAPDDGIVITTEKDFMRLKHFKEIQKSKYKWYYQSITVEIDKKDNFNLLINSYVNEI